MPTPRNHHYIPVFYLKNWAQLDGRLIEYSRPYPGRFGCNTVGPRATGFQRDLYSFAESPPEVAQFLESVFLQRADGIAAIALRKLVAGETATGWTPELRSAWSRQLMGFLMRHPHPFAEIKAAASRALMTPHPESRAIYSAMRRPYDPPTLEEWLARLDGPIVGQLNIWLIKHLMDNERIGNNFNALQWNVLDLAAARHRLLCSDWPLHREVRNGNLFFTLPISPTLLFTATADTNDFRSLRQMRPDDLVRWSNQLTASRARLFVYASDHSQRRFVENRMSTDMLPTPLFPAMGFQ